MKMRRLDEDRGRREQRKRAAETEQQEGGLVADNNEDAKKVKLTNNQPIKSTKRTNCPWNSKCDHMFERGATDGQRQLHFHTVHTQVRNLYLCPMPGCLSVRRTVSLMLGHLLKDHQFYSKPRAERVLNTYLFMDRVSHYKDKTPFLPYTGNNPPGPEFVPANVKSHGCKDALLPKIFELLAEIGHQNPYLGLLRPTPTMTSSNPLSSETVKPTSENPKKVKITPVPIPASNSKTPKTIAKKSEKNKSMSSNNVLNVKDENVPPAVDVSALTEQTLRDRVVQAKNRKYESEIQALKQRVQTLEQQVEEVGIENRELRQGLHSQLKGGRGGPLTAGDLKYLRITQSWVLTPGRHTSVWRLMPGQADSMDLHPVGSPTIL